MSTPAQYSVLGPLKSGAETRAFLGCEVVDGVPVPSKPVVIVWLPDDVVGDPKRVARLQRETSFVTQLEHPSIIRVHGLEHFEEGWARVVDFVDGEPLAQVLARAKERFRPIDPRFAARIAADVCDAVSYAHEEGQSRFAGRPVVHGGIRPDTLMVTFSGRAMVTGYGASVLAPTQHGAPIRDKFVYLAPEQIIGGKATASPATDIYAIGAVLYELLAGKPPFADEEDPERAVLTGAPPIIDAVGLEGRLGNVAATALAKRGSERFETVDLMRDAIVAAVEAEGSELPTHEALAELVGALIPEDGPERSSRRELLESAKDPDAVTILSASDDLPEGVDRKLFERSRPTSSVQRPPRKREEVTVVDGRPPAPAAPIRVPIARDPDTVVEEPSSSGAAPEPSVGSAEETEDVPRAADAEAAPAPSVAAAPTPAAAMDSGVTEAVSPEPPPPVVEPARVASPVEAAPAPPSADIEAPPASPPEAAPSPAESAPAPPSADVAPPPAAPPSADLQPPPAGAPAQVPANPSAVPPGYPNQAPLAHAQGHPGYPPGAGPPTATHPPQPGYPPQPGAPAAPPGYGQPLAPGQPYPGAPGAGQPSGPYPHPGAGQPSGGYPHPGAGQAPAGYPHPGAGQPSGGYAVPPGAGQPSGGYAVPPGAGQPSGGYAVPPGQVPPGTYPPPTPQGGWPGAQPGPGWGSAPPPGGVPPATTGGKPVPRGFKPSAAKKAEPKNYLEAAQAGSQTPAGSGDLLENQPVSGLPPPPAPKPSTPIRDSGSLITKFNKKAGDASRYLIFFALAALVGLSVFIFASKEPPEGLDAPPERHVLPKELVQEALRNTGKDDPDDGADDEPLVAVGEPGAALDGGVAGLDGGAPPPPEPGRLRLDSDPPVTIYDGSKELGRTPITVTLDPGRHRLRFTDAQTGINVYKTYRVKPGATHRHKVVFGTSKLVVNAPDGAIVSLNARRLGKAPLDEVTIYEGRYLLRVVYDGMSWKETFDAPPGRKIEYNVTMREE